jgi:hypothetical protein
VAVRNDYDHCEHMGICSIGEAMTLTELVPSLDLCQRLKAAGFPQDTALRWVEIEGGYQCDENGDPQQEMPPRADVVFADSQCHGTMLCGAPTAGELEEWLMTKPLFSKRVASLHILYRGVKVQGEYVIHYFISALNGAGEEIGRVEALTLLAALAGLVLEVAR